MVIPTAGGDPRGTETPETGDAGGGRTVSAVRNEEDAPETSLRPQTLAEFVGQAATRGNLAVFIQAARARGEALDHVLLHGPPGLGKTTLAQIVAREMGVGFRATSGPVIQRSGDLAELSRRNTGYQRRRPGQRGSDFRCGAAFAVDKHWQLVPSSAPFKSF